MNAKNTIDKLILCYQIIDGTDFNRSYINNYSETSKTFDFGGGIKGYTNNEDKEKEIARSFAIKLEDNGKDIGTLFITNANSEFFYFKYHKSIFYENHYSVLEIKGIIDLLFQFDYHFHQITRLEIACDTTGDSGNDLFVIADLCSENQYFRSLKNSDRIKKSAENRGGRSLEDARYSLALGNTKIYHHTKFQQTTCIGNPKSNIFMRCYNKSEFSQDYQKSYFGNIFPDGSEIFRLEVSLNSEAIKEFQVQFEHLEKEDYLKFIYLRTAKPRLTFNDKSESEWVNGNRVFKKICLVDLLDFGNVFEDLETLEMRYSISEPNPVNEKTPNQLITERRARVGTLIGNYLRNENREEAFNQIFSSIESENLVFSNSGVNRVKNLGAVNNLIESQLENKDFLSALTNTQELRDRLRERFNNNIHRSVNNSEIIGRFEGEGQNQGNQRLKTKVTRIVATTTIKEIEKSRKPYGILLKRIDKSTSVAFI